MRESYRDIAGLDIVPYIYRVLLDREREKTLQHVNMVEIFSERYANQWAKTAIDDLELLHHKSE